MSDTTYEARLAKQLYRQERWSEAEAAFRLAIAKRPEDADLHLQLAYCIPFDERPDEALSLFRRATELNPHLADAYNGMGMCEDSLENAEKAFRKALTIEPTSAEFHNNLAVCLVRQGRREDAESCFRRSFELNPKDLTCAVDWAELLIELGRMRDAEGVYRRAVRGLSSRQGLLDRRAWWHYGDARHDDAEEMFDRLRQGKPKELEAWVYAGWGRVLRMQKKLARAIDCLRIAVGLAPQVAQIHAELGSALEDARMPDEAGVAYRRAEELAQRRPVE